VQISNVQMKPTSKISDVQISNVQMKSHH